MKKRILAAAMAACMLLSVCMPSMAADSFVEDTTLLGITPFYVNTSSVTFGITYASGVATCSSRVIGKSGTKSIAALYTLQRKTATGYTNVAQWTVNATGTVLTLSKAFAVTKGETYRLSLTATVVSSANVSEKLNLTSANYKYT